MLAPDIVENTDYRKFFDLIKFGNTDPVQFFHTKFAHNLKFMSKFRRFPGLSNAKFINTQHKDIIILTDNPIFAVTNINSTVNWQKVRIRKISW